MTTTNNGVFEAFQPEEWLITIKSKFRASRPTQNNPAWTIIRLVRRHFIIDVKTL